MDGDNPLRHTKHIFRVLLLLAAVMVLLTLGRSFFVPESWARYGWYRGDNVAEQRAKPVRHGGDDACAECHDGESAAHAGGKHAQVRCEVCHAPVAVHVTDGDRTAEMPKDPSVELCGRCHRRLDARPASFPQVQPRQHVEEQGGTFAGQVCVECHPPHAPL